MLKAEPKPSFDALTARLTAAASKLADAQAEQAKLKQPNDPRRWRDAQLLWPPFTRG